MPKLKTFVLFAVALFASAANALSPNDGHIAGKSYVNNYFHLSYAWPALLKPMPLPAAPTDAKENILPLFTARQGDLPFGVVVVAEKLDVAGPHSAALKGSADLIDRIAHSLRPGPVLTNIARSQKKSGQGRVFDVLSYQINGKPASVMATQAGDYLLVFKCNAQSTGDIAQMENSVLALHAAK